MGNSHTSRYADGRDLYHPDALDVLRRLATQRAADADLREASQALARRRLRPAKWRDLRASVRRAPEPQLVPPRRGAGEGARLLLDPQAGPEVRRIARRHHVDEGDVASLWAALLARPATGSLTDFVAEAAAA